MQTDAESTKGRREKVKLNEVNESKTCTSLIIISILIGFLNRQVIALISVCLGIKLTLLIWNPIGVYG